MSDPPVLVPTGCADRHQLLVDGLCVTYGQTAALREITFDTTCGHRLALVGPNGAGKSTLIRSLAGLVSRDHGEILWRGKALARGSADIAYLPQRATIDWNFPATVRHVVEMGRFPHLTWWRRFGEKDRRAVDDAIAMMDLEPLQDRQISALSGGQQQRTFLARALAQEAHVLLLDEPFTGLDATATSTLTALFTTLAERGHLIIASHHDLESVVSIYDQVLLLDCEPVAFGPVAEAFTAKSVARAYGRPDSTPRSRCLS